MKRGLVVLLLIMSAVLIKPHAQTGGKNEQTLLLYREALNLFERSTPNAFTDSLALSKFVSVANRVTANEKNALTIFDCYEKAGILRQTYGSQQTAMAFYKKAIAVCVRYELSDSLLFKPYLFCGMGNFFLHSFDSTTHYLKKAETILLKFPTIKDAQRLYNSFGAIYYEAGNYQQSINYFGKALQIIQRSRKPDPNSVYTFKSNIASALRHLEQYDSAAVLYKSLIPLHINTNEVLINLGLVYLKKSDPDSALVYLLPVKGDQTNRSIILENALASAYIQKNNGVEAIRRLKKSLDVHEKNQLKGSVGQKAKSIGLTYKLLADIERQKRNLPQALSYYQQSIIQLDDGFNDTVIYRNPSEVTAGFRSYGLFESLAAKAGCLQQFYRKNSTDKNLKITIETYQSALKLAEYIEKSFDSEDARLFIVRNVFPVYQEAVAFMIYAFDRTRDRSYLEEAFRWAEKSKAATLYINLRENEFKSYAGIPDSLLGKERNLKFNMSRLLLSLDKATSAAEITILNAAMQDNKLFLSRLADKLNEYPDYHRRKFSFDSISISHLQHNIVNRHTALVAYFQGKDDLFCFVVTRNSIQYQRSKKDSLYYRALRGLSTELRTFEPGAAYRGSSYAKLLYDRLIKPLLPDLSAVTSLIVVPHNELNLLPFEVLQDENGVYLLEKFAVTYQYAASFLQNQREGTPDFNRTLSVTPFDSIDDRGIIEFAKLPASDEETAALAGTKLTHKSATKENFKKLVEDASVIHLATHAVVNSDDPSRSYIAFYPTGNDDNRLYAHELRNLSLSKTNLTFLSACETASGKLINGEGVMSLSRAISYAGCPNLVTSLWKAEDNATAHISARFYFYLREGHSFSESLQKAKLDLLHNGQYAQYHSPQYWSHLVFVGTASQTSSQVYRWILLTFVLSAVLFISWWVRIRL